MRKESDVTTTKFIFILLPNLITVILINDIQKIFKDLILFCIFILKQLVMN